MCGNNSALYSIIFIRWGKVCLSLFNIPIILEHLLDTFSVCFLQFTCVSRVRPKKLNSSTFSMIILIILGVSVLTLTITVSIFIIKQTIEQHREGQKDIRVTFVDLEKAYDRVPKEEIWRCMRERNVPEKYVKLIQDMYIGCQTKVRSAAGESGSFNVDVGLHPGSALSPYLFLILMDVLTEGVRTEVPESIMFADDIVLCGGREIDMTEYLDRWRKSLEERGMRVSRPKTQFMDFNFEHS